MPHRQERWHRKADRKRKVSVRQTVKLFNYVYVYEYDLAVH